MSNYSTADEIKKYKDLLDQGVITEEEFNAKKAALMSEQPTGSSTSAGMSKQATDIIAYITWIGFFIALIAGDRQASKFHLNQALVLNLFSLLSIIPLVGWIWGIVVFIFWIMGLVSACSGEEKPVPLLGGIKILQ